MQSPENALVVLNYLFYLIDNSANDPNQVREYVRGAQAPMRALRTALGSGTIRVEESPGHPPNPN